MHTTLSKSTTLLATFALFYLTACGSSLTSTEDLLSSESNPSSETLSSSETINSSSTQSSNSDISSSEGISSENTTSSSSSSTGTNIEDTSGEFSNRDLEQTADLSEATYLTVVSNQDLSITEPGVYVISGTATNSSIIIETADTAKVQLVFDGVSITNQDAPAVYVKSADKVFVTTAAGTTNSLEVTGTFVADGETNLDAVIYSKEDLVLNGEGTLNITSAQGNGVTSKDDLKVTGGTLNITAALDALEANDSVRIAGGDITINAGKDGIHAEYDEDDTVGYVYISGGTLNITAGDDGIQATTVLQVEGGTINVLNSTEGFESTYILINDGTIDIYATDDGINASAKSTAYDVLIEVNGGNIAVEVQGNDVDGFDANGSIVINGGTIAVTCPTQAPSGAFDADVSATLNGGTVTVNGEVVTTLAETNGPPTRG